MAQMLRVAALAVSGLVWLALGLVLLPAAERGSGNSPLLQTFVTATFIVALAWAAAAIAYDRGRRRSNSSPTR